MQLINLIYSLVSDSDETTSSFNLEKEMVPIQNATPKTKEESSDAVEISIVYQKNQLRK